MATDYTLREGMSCGITPEHALSQMTTDYTLREGMSCGITPEHALSQMTTDYTLREGMSCGITPEHALSQMTQSCDPVTAPFLTASISYGPFTQADRVLLYLSSVSALRQSVGHQVPLHAQGPHLV